MVVETPNGLIAENPLVPRVLLPRVLAPRVGVPNPVEVAPLPKEKPVELLPKRPPVVAAAIFLPIQDNIQSKYLLYKIDFIASLCITGYAWGCTFPIWRPKEVEVAKRRLNQEEIFIEGNI